MNWTLVSVPVPAGVHTLRWSYEKDENTSTGSDCAWIDLVTYAGPAGRDWRILSGVNPEAALRLDFDGTGGDELAGDLGRPPLALRQAHLAPAERRKSDASRRGRHATEPGDRRRFGRPPVVDNGGSWQILSAQSAPSSRPDPSTAAGPARSFGGLGTSGCGNGRAGAWSQIPRPTRKSCSRPSRTQRRRKWWRFRRAGLCAIPEFSLGPLAATISN